MSSNFLPDVSLALLNEAYEAGSYDRVYDLLVEPLHEELYRRKTFDFLDDLSRGQQLLLAYDYVRTQVLQGGFIQFIENGYISLLPGIIEQFNNLGGAEMAQVLDDVLKVFVLNAETLNKPTTVQEFAKLYDEFKEFEIIDARFYGLNEAAMKLMLDYAMSHLSEFVSGGG